MSTSLPRKRTARVLGVLIVCGALVTGWCVYQKTVTQPRTDDSEVFANLIGIAPEVNGPIIKIYVKDNQLVKKGDLLFEIAPEPYQYALDAAKSQQNSLEGEIKDLNRKIASQKSATVSAHAGIGAAHAVVEESSANINAAQAGILNARAGIVRAESDHKYAQDNLHRLESLLKKQFVTVDQVEQARTGVQSKLEAIHQAQSQLALAQAQLNSIRAQRHASSAQLEQSRAQFQEAVNSVAILDPLLAQRQQRKADVNTAAYNLSRCKVRAPFDARVTNLLISEGEYAHAGKKVFTLIDTRHWWAIANFRESQLAYIQPGMKADVYVMSRPNHRYEGVVDSIGYGVEPDSNLIGGFSESLPDVKRTLNWVRLSSRFPVRVKVDTPSPEHFRIGASAMVIIRGK